RWCGGGGGDEPGQSRGAAPDLGSADRGARGGGGSGFHVAIAAGPGDRQGVCAGGARPEGFGSGGDQRGIHGGGGRIDARTRACSPQGEWQWWRDRDGASAGDVRGADRVAFGARVAPSWRWCWRRGVVWWWRS